MADRVSLDIGVIVEEDEFTERSFVAGTRVVLSFFTELADRSFRFVASCIDWSDVLKLRS
jgi:hypothetical protein